MNLPDYPDQFFANYLPKLNVAAYCVGLKKRSSKMTQVQSATTSSSIEKPLGRGIALVPILLFLAIFIGSGIYHSLAGTDFAFYQLKAPVAVLPALILALFISRQKLNAALETFLEGIGNVNLITMCMVFLLAGAFAAVTKAIGGVDATVALGLSLVPESLVLPGIFVIAAFIATAMGTSMGTIAAVAPVAVGAAEATGMSLGITMGAVVGGAMFGDNLSIISDTTIAATRSQGCEMKDKFRVNFKLALPAAIITLISLFILNDAAPVAAKDTGSILLVVPYIAVLALALSGLNVLLVLGSGILISGVIGLLVADYSFGQYTNDIYAGFSNMFEIMLLSMLVGGLSALIKQQGGLIWLSEKIQGLTKNGGKRAGCLGIASLAVGTDACTANNTVAIIISGDVAKDIANEHGIEPKQTASLLDIFSCAVQGVIPWGAQLLLAGSIAGLSPVELSLSVHYCLALAVIALASIWLQKVPVTTGNQKKFA